MIKKIFLLIIFVIGVVNANGKMDCFDAVRLALKNNHQLNENKAKVQESYWNRWEARSNHLPTVKLGYTKMRDDEENVIPAGIVGPQEVVIQPLEIGSQSVDVSLPLFTGGALFSGSKIAGTNYKMSKLSLLEQEELIKYKTIEAYYNVVKLQGIVDITSATKTLIDENIRITNKMYELGMVKMSDKLKAEVSSMEMDQQIISAKQGLELSKTNLSISIGQSLKSEVVLNKEIPRVNFTKSEKEAIKYAKENRANYLSIMMTEKMAKWGVRASRGGYFPSVAGVFHWEKSDEESMFSRSESWRAMLTVSYELPLGLSNVAKVQKAKAKLKQTEEIIKQIETGIEVEVKANFLNYNLSNKKLSIAEKQVKASLEGFNATNASYKTGNSTQIELIDARNSYKNAQINLIATKIDHYISYNKLLQSCGYKLDLGKRLKEKN